MRTESTRAAAKSFLALTAADLMSRPVMTIPQGMPLGEAARLLSGSNISGAPVVDAHGRCIGVLSSSDFVTWAGQEGKVINFIAPWGEIIDIEDFPDNEIRHYMATKPVAVAPKTPVGELAQTMADAHIHRVLVIADDGLPCGIVSSTDVLAAVGRAGPGPSSGRAKGKV
jgi:CBS domain-containing membrane protein